MSILRFLHQPRTYTWVIIASVNFVVMTFVAMLFYPGGHSMDPNGTGYTFTLNYFSSLGVINAYGQPNYISAVLFFIALAGGGAAMILFFLDFPNFCSSNWVLKLISWAGSFFGVLAGLGFIGIALTPADIFPEAHNYFVLRAFMIFPIAAAIYTIAIFFSPDFPSRYALVFLVFTLMLVGYYNLLINGPATDTLEGLRIQSTGQKIIGYATVISVLIQSYGARKILLAEQEPQPAGQSLAVEPLAGD